MIRRHSAALGVAALGLFASISGCQRPSTLLTPGALAPKIEAAGWVNGAAPTDADLAGRVVVLDVWAHW